MKARLISAALLLMGGLTGCVAPMPEAGYYVYDEERVIVVGKLEIDPPVDVENEQSTQWNVIGDGAILNRVIVATANTPSDEHPENFPMSAWNHHINAVWGDTFMLAAPRERVYLNGAMMQLDMQSGSKVWFPGGVYFEAPAGAKAIYIGTLRYHRGDFWTIKGVEVVNEYREARELFKERFGEDAELQQALFKAVP